MRGGIPPFCTPGDVLRPFLFTSARSTAVGSENGRVAPGSVGSGPNSPWGGDGGVGRSPIDPEVDRLMERGEAVPTLSKLRKSVDG